MSEVEKMYKYFCFLTGSCQQIVCVPLINLLYSYYGKCTWKETENRTIFPIFAFHYLEILRLVSLIFTCSSSSKTVWWGWKVKKNHSAGIKSWFSVRSLCSILRFLDQFNSAPLLSVRSVPPSHPHLSWSRHEFDSFARNLVFNFFILDGTTASLPCAPHSNSVHDTIIITKFECRSATKWSWNAEKSDTINWT